MSNTVGETHKRLYDRFSEHLGYIRTKKVNKATGEHYNQPGHSASNMTVTILEKVINPDWQYRKKKEKNTSYLLRRSKFKAQLGLFYTHDL